MLDLQKASMLKRISAFILDVILLAVAITGFAFFLSAVTGYDSYNEKLDAIYASYEEEYGVKVGISLEEFEALTEEQIEQYKVDFEKHLNAPNPKYSYLSGYIFAQEYKKLNN